MERAPRGESRAEAAGHGSGDLMRPVAPPARGPATRWALRLLVPPAGYPGNSVAELGVIHDTRDGWAARPEARDPAWGHVEIGGNVIAFRLYGG